VSSNPPAVRRATAADIPVMRRLWDEFSAEGHYTPYPPSPFDPALVRDHVALIAEEDGEVVGTVYANLSTTHFGYVFGVYTVPEARGRGVGRALMRAIAEHLRNEGREYVVLSVDTPNEGAREFYDRLGFEDASRMLRAPVDRLLAD
jgi:[ribosomal protein S18]-alanine N-acetyltransferase